MFDKIKEAVGDVLQGKTDSAEKAVSDASAAVDNVAAKAEGAVDSATASTDGASLGNLSNELSGLVDQAGGLGGIVKELGGLSGVMEAVKGIDFPIDADDLGPLLKKAGLPDGIIDQVSKANVGQIDSADDLVNLAKQFLTK
ncbi:MAG: hypothetical protein QM589_06865 [Thermomicrobiales bacterium]